MKQFYVYILCSERNATLYIGVTSNLNKRVFEHKNKVVPGFTDTYHVDKLVWYEVHEDAVAAITREKQLKKWRRSWKIDLVEKSNPYWNDLYDQL